MKSSKLDVESEDCYSYSGSFLRAEDIVDVANLVQYFNEIIVEANRKTARFVMPERSLVFIVQGHPTSDRVEWSWRLMSRIPEDVVAGILLTMTPDPLGAGCVVVLRVSAHEGEERLNELLQIRWAMYVYLEDTKYAPKEFKDDLIQIVAFELSRACEYLVRVAPRLGEISVNKDRIEQEMKILNFTLHRAN